MNWVHKIQQAIDYIECNLEEKISVDEVARAVMYSPVPLQYLFSAMTGYSVGEYIRFRRLDCAVNDLFDNKLSVTETAFKYQYETVEAFSKAFKRAYSVSPSKFTKTNSRYRKFAPIKINFNLTGGFNMEKNFIMGLRKINIFAPPRNNEYIQCVISALGALGEDLDYDYVTAISGSSFRTTYSPFGKFDSGLPGIANNLWTVEHTFKMLGYRVNIHRRSDYETDKKLIMDSIDRGVPVITVAGVLHYCDTCVISGYDNDGEVLLGYSGYMDASDADTEPNDETGYFRKSNWHNDVFAKRNGGFIITIGEKTEKPPKDIILRETFKIIVKLIKTEEVNERGEGYEQLNGCAAQTAFANAIISPLNKSNEDAMLNLMQSMQQYSDKTLPVKFFKDNGRNDLAKICEKIKDLCDELSKVIPLNFDRLDYFEDKQTLKKYSDILLQIRDLENEFAKKAELSCML